MSRAKILQHYGIKGMQWGVRRKRNSKTGRVESSDSRAARKLKRKKLSELNNEELRKLNTRLQLERQYKDLSARDVSKGRKFFQDVLTNSGKQIATNYVSKAGEEGISRLISLANEQRKNRS